MSNIVVSQQPQAKSEIDTSDASTMVADRPEKAEQENPSEEAQGKPFALFYSPFTFAHVRSAILANVGGSSCSGVGCRDICECIVSLHNPFLIAPC